MAKKSQRQPSLFNNDPSLLRIDTLRLRNFRQFENAAFKFHPHFNVLIGKNGKGKTTVLDALAIMLNTYFQGSGITASGGQIRDDDIRLQDLDKPGGQLTAEKQNQEAPTHLIADGFVHEERCDWRRDKGDRAGQAKEFVRQGHEARNKVKNGVDNDLPVIAYYGTGRLWDFHNKRNDGPTNGAESRLTAYDYCLNSKTDHKKFTEWLRKLTFGQVQKNEKRPALDAIREAVLTCVPESINFFFDLENNFIKLELEGKKTHPFHMLSDGYRNLTAIAADLAHRAAKLNPHHMAEAAAKAQGVVLIDELDLHLHPEWQREVVERLTKAFPGIQFITASHSPFILQSLEAGQVIDLDRVLTPEELEHEIAQDPIAAAPGPVKGEYADKSIEDVTEEVMGVELPQMSRRRIEMKEAAQQYYEILQQGKSASEEEKARLSAKLDELTAPFSDDVAYHAFLEMERIAAGFAPSKRMDK